jgi:hypothetical protein
MRKLLVVPLLAGALALAAFVPRGTAAPDDKPVKYEYAELTYGRVLDRPQVGPGGPGGPPGGGPAPGLPPGGPGLGANLRTAIKWTTGEEEVEFPDWSEFGDKLKAPAPKKDSPQSVHRLRVLNKLSADGWEMLDKPLGEARAAAGFGMGPGMAMGPGGVGMVDPRGSQGTFTFRRRVP